MGGMLSKPKAPPPPQPIKIDPVVVPEVKAPAPMPVTDDDAVKSARKKKLAETMARSGRSSTILTGTDTLG